MTPRRLEALQEAILDSIKAAHPGTTDKAIAVAAGVERTQISNWRAGARPMKVSELADMLPTFGAAAVLGPIAALDEADVVERDPRGPADPKTLALQITLHSQLSANVHEALEDRVIDPDELAAITAAAERLVLELRQLQAGARNAA